MERDKKILTPLYNKHWQILCNKSSIDLPNNTPFDPMDSDKQLECVNLRNGEICVNVENFRQFWHNN